jgi:hypothetical protein
LQDQAARSGRTAGILDGGLILAGNLQRFIGACGDVEVVEVRERPEMDCGSNCGRGVKTINWKGYSFDESLRRLEAGAQ